MNSWKKTSSKKIFNHPRLSLVEDQVKLPSGKTTTYLRYEGYPDAVTIIARNKDGKILVQKEYSYPPNKWLYQFPGGGINNNETPEQGASRELAEEANLKARLKKLGWFYFNNRRTDAKFYVFVGLDIKEIPESHAPKDDEEEFVDYWLSEQEIEDLIHKGEIKNYSMLAAWAFYKNSKI